MAPLRYTAKFDPFLSLDGAPTPSTLAQSKERKGSNFAIWLPCRDIRRGEGHNFKFNMSASDVMVFLHIQKTGGTTFGKHLVQDIDLEEPCSCKNVPKKKKLLRKKKVKNKKNMYRIKCRCLRPGDSGEMWLFSRYSTGWKCGLHPDWTELTSCVNNYLDATEGMVARWL